jgi:hypothetical protein
LPDDRTAGLRLALQLLAFKKQIVSHWLAEVLERMSMRRMFA